MNTALSAAASRAVIVALCWVLVPTPANTEQASRVEQFRVPGFGQVTTYRPPGDPGGVVLFLSGDGGWNLGVVSMAQRLAQEGAVVVGIDTRAFIKTLNGSTSCGYPSGMLEELSRTVQRRLKLPAYSRPVIVGYSSGATLAYAAVAAAPPETFAGAISVGFCPDLELHAPLCQMRGLRSTKKARSVGYDLAPFAGLSVPWMVLQGEQDQVCAPATTRAFVAATGQARLFSLPKVGHGFGVAANWEPEYVEAYRAIVSGVAKRNPPRATAPAVVDLSLVEVPATGRGTTDTFAVILSGDGGWAELDKAVAAGLAAQGIPVVGWSSLDYYWSPRTPESAAADLARIVDHYTVAWSRPRAMLIGYSFGADVAPFLVNRVPDRVRAHIASLALLAPSEAASFEFHVTDWLGGRSDARFPIRPEMDRVSVRTRCISPTDEPASACATANPLVTREAAAAGHHFGGRYDQLVTLIVK